MTFRYAGFISYAHADEAIAARLHRRLETYPIPKSLAIEAAHTTDKQRPTRDKLSPIFRDTTELTAHHNLTEKIQEAVQSSRVLIVICSPTAKASHWVNEEIRLFRSLHGEEAILCVLAKGTPESSFPPALTEEGREPLAANLSGSKDNFKRGITQLAASMLGVGLDDLIQRESKRRRRLQTLITASALIFSGIMGAMTLTAIEARSAAVDARNEAQESRAQAEGLVEYMITDLKDKLEPLGKLDLLDSIGDEAVKYYDTQNIEDLSDESLTRQASARHILGQVAFDSGTLDKARRESEAAAKLTAEVLTRNPDNSGAIFGHAQSEYWVGQGFRTSGDYETAMKHWRHYATLGEQLYEKDPENFDWVMERAYGLNNLAYLYYQFEDYTLAQEHYLDSINYYEKALDIRPNSPNSKKSLANAIAGVSNIAFQNKDFELSETYVEKQIDLLSEIIKSNPQHKSFQFRYDRARANLYRAEVFIDPENCNLTRSTLLMDKLKTYIDHDTKNYDWQSQYVRYWYNTLKPCMDSYSKRESNEQVEKLLSHIGKALKKEDQEKARAAILLLKR